MPFDQHPIHLQPLSEIRLWSADGQESVACLAKVKRNGKEDDGSDFNGDGDSDEERDERGLLSFVDEGQFERVKTICVSIGEIMVRPLAEALVAEERARPRERLTSMLIAFGASGRHEAERLKSSPNPAVRRTAFDLRRRISCSWSKRAT